MSTRHRGILRTQTAHRGYASCAVALSMLLTLGACENPADPPFPDSIARVSGNDQYSKKGTEVAAPLVVRATLNTGEPATGVAVVFQIIAGGGSVTTTRAVTNDVGRAQTKFTLGPGAGANRVRASLDFSPDRYVDFAATSADFFCPEDDPAFVRLFTPAGALLLVTRRSRLNTQGGVPVSGIVRITPDFLSSSCQTSSFKTFMETTLDLTVRDYSFSRHGDFFVSWANVASDEVIKVDVSASFKALSRLEDDFGSEITDSPSALLIGCDRMGPFAVGCRDTLQRFAGATHAGDGVDDANNDAVAVDPNTDDIYYISLFDNTLRRVPLDTLRVTGPVQTVVALTNDEASGARGMVVDEDDGSVFILVHSTNTRAIIKVTSSGTKNVAYDFFSRGAGTAAGNQADLTIARNGGGGGILYTIDTENNLLLAYDILQGTLVALPPNGFSDPESLSLLGSAGEPVGLVVLP